VKQIRVAGTICAFLLISVFVWVVQPRQIVAEPAYATTATIITNDILTDTVWTPARNPYVLQGNIAVSSGVTLTVEPGVTVLGETLSDLLVDGRLVAVGTVTQPITFTGVSTSAGAWGGIEISGTSSAWNSGSRLEYVTVAYGGESPSKGNLSLVYASASIRHSQFDYALGDGIFGYYAGGYADISDTQFNGNSGYAVNFEQGGKAPVFSNLAASGNGADGVALGYGILNGDATWYNMGLPYFLQGIITVSSGVTLTVEPGVTVLGETSSDLLVDGRLVAVGTVTQPITFTAVDTATGWGGISIEGTSAVKNIGSRLRYVTVAYGGHSPNSSNLVLDYAQAVIDHATIKYSLSNGIDARNNSLGSIEASRIFSNSAFGAEADAGSRWLAANNWWGDASGPQASGGCNPGGTGETISGHVVFVPFLTAADQDPGVLAPGDALLLSLSPQKWIVPADGVTRA